MDLEQAASEPSAVPTEGSGTAAESTVIPSSGDAIAGRGIKLSRRRFVGLVGAGTSAVAGLAISPVGLTNRPRHLAASSNDDQDTGFREPASQRSRNGVLAVTLHASVSQTSFAGRPVTSALYNGTFPGPTLRVHPGDLLVVTLVNDLAEPTNLHFHGSHVSPAGHGDNIFIHVLPGESFTYAYDIASDHRAGLNWYHPHSHGTNENQVFGGMAGAIIVEGDLDELPGITGLEERLLFLQYTVVGNDGRTLHVDETHVDDPADLPGVEYVLVNGQFEPTLSIRPGETQRWRIANASANRFFLLVLEGHQFHLIARDGDPLSHVQTVDELLMGPGQRREVLVQGGPAGVYTLRSLAYAWGFDTDPYATVGYLKSEGEPLALQPLPAALLPVLDLRDLAIDRKREFTLGIEQTDDLANPRFVVDGQIFDPNRIDVVTELGSIEEWTIINASDDWHPFHIHINDIQVVAINGQPVDNFGYEDTVLVPPKGGTMTFRTHFEDFLGKFVWHCHILRHEERGMMQVIEVVARGSAASFPQSTPTSGTAPAPGDHTHH